ncbi:hypothetical protein PV783_32150 [Chitinophaga sp. CC14]|uniref:hypothetical protein n=1 Tax=Chitinophaga sp. CC14 TaxID=3029199 RepID=UPI003B7E4D10
MKILKKILFPALMVAALFTSCSKDDDKPAGTSHKVVFKAIGSTGVELNIAVFGYDDQATTLSNLSGNTWTSNEITAPASARNVKAVINGLGPNVSATLKVQVLVDGQVKAEGTSSGTVLSGLASYNF